jgi:hypothetical protein
VPRFYPGQEERIGAFFYGILTKKDGNMQYLADTFNDWDYNRKPEMTLENAKQQLKNLLDIQLSDGNWNANEYMFGMANAMILAYAILNNTTPIYLDRPDYFLNDKPVEHEAKKVICDNNGINKISTVIIKDSGKNWILPGTYYEEVDCENDETGPIFTFTDVDLDWEITGYDENGLILTPRFTQT